MNEVSAPTARGRLLLGDNLVALAALPADSIDLVYMDPPFATGRDYAVGAAAFSDSWRWDDAARAALAAEPEGPAGELLRAAVRHALRFSPVAAYLVWMARRLRQVVRTVKRRGAIWLHCDDHASHYLALLLQALHVERHGRPMHAEMVVWKRSSGANHSVNRWVRVSDHLLFLGPGARFRIQGVGTIWDDVQPLNARDGARIGYPTEKPVALIDRVLAVSARDGDQFLDPFCGSGPSLIAADRRLLRWIGMDASEQAIEAVRRRFTADDGAMAYGLFDAPGRVA